MHPPPQKKTTCKPTWSFSRAPFYKRSDYISPKVQVIITGQSSMREILPPSPESIFSNLVNLHIEKWDCFDSMPVLYLALDR